MRLVFATNNPHKLAELRAILGKRVELVSLADIGCHEDIPEDYETLQENALEKARFVSERFGCDCFADDTGLEIEALGGRPGVYSARYAGEGKNPEDNMRKVLREMEGMKNRRAQFRTVIALILEGRTYYFEGKVTGEMLTERHGKGGFGYDPIFRPDGYKESFAEMDMKTKNAISHRGRAVEKLVCFLNHQLEGISEERNL